MLLRATQFATGRFALVAGDAHEQANAANLGASSVLTLPRLVRQLAERRAQSPRPKGRGTPRFLVVNDVALAQLTRPPSVAPSASIAVTFTRMRVRSAIDPASCSYEGRFSAGKTARLQSGRE